MYGNLSQTVIQVPNMFHILSHLSSEKFAKTRYRELPLLDTFSQMKKVNSPLKNRYFRVNDHFKTNSVYKDLNYNNNKRYISPVTKLQSNSCNNFFASNNQIRIISNNKKFNISIDSSKTLSKDNIKDINTQNENNRCYENNRYNNYEKNNNVIDDLTDNPNNNEKSDENIQNENNNREDEKTKITKYLNILREKKPQNLKELKELLDMNYMNFMKIEDKKRILFPSIKGIHRSISQEDLFMKSLDKKLESLTTIKSSVKASLSKRKKNIILKKDYDLFLKFNGNHQKISFPSKYNFKTNSIVK
jgi:hypothetical protein